jgi:transcriptional regulator with GAF, ATPase, and Fis domain
VGRSEPIRRVIETINAVAGSTATVLVTGESGTGKELVARLIHRCSPRSSRPFVVVNCPSLPDTLVEAELFGVERGVATGVEARRGKFEQAHEGTLFLDEVGDLDASAQAKLLRALSEKTIERVGGRGPVPVDVRVVAATNHDLRSEVERGAFRRDLYHRLNTVTVRLPPLRERREDVPLLVAHFVARGPGPRKTLSEAALEALSRHDFPGNVRELEHVIERAQLLARGPVVEAEDLPEEVAPAPGGDALGLTDRLLERLVREGESFWDVVATPFLRRELSREDVRRLITRAHAQAGGSYVEMARLLRIEGEYRRLLNFLHYHQLCVPR